MSFHDDLASLCAKALASANRNNDDDARADIVTALSTMLGRSIGRIAEGNSVIIETLLEGSENLVASEAADFANFYNSIQRMKANP